MPGTYYPSHQVDKYHKAGNQIVGPLGYDTSKQGRSLYGSQLYEEIKHATKEILKRRHNMKSVSFFMRSGSFGLFLGYPLEWMVGSQ